MFIRKKVMFSTCKVSLYMDSFLIFSYKIIYTSNILFQFFWVTRGLGRVCFIQNSGLQLTWNKSIDPPGQPKTRVNWQKPGRVLL